MSAKGKMILTAVAVCTLLAAYTEFNSSSIPEIPFNSNEWKAVAGDRSSSIRLAMLEDLLSTHELT